MGIIFHLYLEQLIILGLVGKFASSLLFLSKILCRNILQATCVVFTIYQDIKYQERYFLLEFQTKSSKEAQKRL